MMQIPGGVLSCLDVSNHVMGVGQLEIAAMFQNA